MKKLSSGPPPLGEGILNGPGTQESNFVVVSYPLAAVARLANFMKRLRIYVWTAAFVFLANAWLCHEFSSQKIFSSELPIWHSALTHIALISQLPSLPLSKIIADWFGVSYCGWALASSVISIVLYFPLIHLARPWTLSVSLRSIRRKAAAFSASLNPCVPSRKRVGNSDIYPAKLAANGHQA